MNAVDDEWKQDVGRISSASQRLLDGLRSEQDEPTGWNAIVANGLVPTDLKRKFGGYLLLSVPQFGLYDIAAPETISLAIPGAALRSGQLRPDPIG